MHRKLKTMNQHYTSLATETTVESLNKGEHLCKEYFLAGYTNNEICSLLEVRHNIILSTRHLRRILSSMGLRRRTSTDIPQVVSAIQTELNGSGSDLGYRALQKRLLSKYGLVVPRELVSITQNVLDPEGVEARRNHRLRRRIYLNDGPNFMIHIDGYDKLKRFGFAIHGAIDGFSRRVLWLEVGRSNNKPEVVALNFVNYLEEIQGVPRCIRIDAGTENTIIADIQVALREQHTDDMAGDRSVIVGSSPHNQRIERYWRTNREGGGQFWINYFKDLELSHRIDLLNNTHIECLRFSFTEVIQADMSNQREDWNQHRTRQSSNRESLGGKPDMMFFVPSLFDSEDYKSSATHQALQDVREAFCEQQTSNGCERLFSAECEEIMRLHQKSKPTNHLEALNLFTWLINQL